MDKLYLLMLLLSEAEAYALLSIPANWSSHVLTPKTNIQLKNAICSKYSKGYCVDNDFKVVLLTKIFDFRKTEGVKTELGCYHLLSRNCLRGGQKQLNVNNQCKDLKRVRVTYDEAGEDPLVIGSNKFIVSRNGGLRGKGLQIKRNRNILISGLSITDINPEVIWGGDAISLSDSENVWIYGNYFSRIGRQMIVTGFGSNKNIVISDNEFDGRTRYSAYCDGQHYWLWLFLGSDDRITIFNNYVHHTSGRGPHMTGIKNSKVLLHMVKNRFENINHAGLVNVLKPTGRILMEGNTFRNVSSVVYKNAGRIYYVFNKVYAEACKRIIGRNCYVNNAVKSGGLRLKSDLNVLREFATNMVNTDRLIVNRKFKTAYLGPRRFK